MEHNTVDYNRTSVGNVLIVELLGNRSEFLTRFLKWWQLKRMWLVDKFSPLHVHAISLQYFVSNALPRSLWTFLEYKWSNNYVIFNYNVRYFTPQFLPIKMWPPPPSPLEPHPPPPRPTPPPTPLHKHTPVCRTSNALHVNVRFTIRCSNPVALNQRGACLSALTHEAGWSQWFSPGSKCRCGRETDRQTGRRDEDFTLSWLRSWLACNDTL